MSPDQYLECHLLLAVMNEDTARANDLLGQLGTSERHALMEHVRRIRTAIVDGRFAQDPGEAAMPRAIHGDGGRPESDPQEENP